MISDIKKRQINKLAKTEAEAAYELYNRSGYYVKLVISTISEEQEFFDKKVNKYFQDIMEDKKEELL